MRRIDFLRQDDEFFQEVAQRCQVGYLGLMTKEGFPRNIALNFVALNKAIYFHGALAGQKFDLLSNNPQVGFTMAWELSYIPSNWTGPDYACPATQLYKSVEIQGQGVVVEDGHEKAHALQALMEKHQPGDTFRQITGDEKIYRKALAGTGVFRVDVESWAGKVRLFQEKPAYFRDLIIGKLKERGAEIDFITASQIEEFDPPT